MELEVFKMSIIKEAKKREALEKIRVIKGTLPKIEKLIKDEKITVLETGEVVVDCLFGKIFQVRFKDSKVDFLICEQD
jgi:NAD(P)H-hydrate repair Nnr-like enzyme with NAD(P)H-hydrate epimerase domain